MWTKKKRKNQVENKREEKKKEKRNVRPKSRTKIDLNFQMNGTQLCVLEIDPGGACMLNARFECEMCARIH